jgi:hypothetical protein
MTFEQIVTVRVTFAARRRELFSFWLLSHSIHSPGVAQWAERLRETNDAEIAFGKLVEAL